MYEFLALSCREGSLKRMGVKLGRIFSDIICRAGETCINPLLRQERRGHRVVKLSLLAGTMILRECLRI